MPPSALLPTEPSKSARVCCDRHSFGIPGALYLRARLILKLVLALALELAGAQPIDCGLRFGKK